MDCNTMMKSPFNKMPFGSNMKMNVPPRLMNSFVNGLWRPPFLPPPSINYSCDATAPKMPPPINCSSLIQNRLRLSSFAHSLQTLAFLQQIRCPGTNLPHSASQFPAEKFGKFEPPVHMVKLKSGLCKRLQDICEDDLMMRNGDCHGYSQSYSEVIYLSPPNIETKQVTIGFLTGNQKKSHYTCNVSKPFFVRGKGWCSLMPPLTFRIYGIQTFQLELGHLCITLATNTINQIQQSERRKRKSPTSHQIHHYSSFNIDHIHKDEIGDTDNKQEPNTKLFKSS